jgi:restriction system protein
MLGKRSALAAECFAGGYIGADFDINENLTGSLSDDWRAFNKKYVPVYLASHPGKTRVIAGLACGALWTITKGIIVGDVVLASGQDGVVRAGEVTGAYQYAPGAATPHRRPVTWLRETIDPSAMSDILMSSFRAIYTVTNLSRHADEIGKLINGGTTISTNDPDVEDPIAFAMEKHLEEFLVRNWNQTELGREYDVFEADGEKVGQQYPSDTGPIDILAIKKDKKELLVIELKRGRASDAVVGQVLRYMGYVAQELAEDGQSVRGVVIALEDDQRIRRALAAAPNVSFYRYQVSFKLLKA